MQLHPGRVYLEPCCWTLTAELAHSCYLLACLLACLLLGKSPEVIFDKPKPSLVLESGTFSGCFPQRGPGRYWPLCWPSLALVSVWPTPTWRCRPTHMNSRNFSHILTCVSAPRWGSDRLHCSLIPIKKLYRTNITFSPVVDSFLNICLLPEISLGRWKPLSVP